MKTRPYIELSERDTILAQLRRKGKWTSKRRGIRVRMWTRREPNGLKVCFQVFPKAHTEVHMVCHGVTAAIAAVNDVLDPAPIPQSWSAPSMPVMPPAPPDRYLPYKDL